MKKIFQAIWYEFVFGSHILSLAAASILLFSMMVIESKINWLYLVIPYLMMQIIYKFNYIIEKEDYSSNPERAGHILKKRKIFIFLILFFSAALVALLIYFQNLMVSIFSVIYVIGGLIYPKSLTKKIIAFKNIYVSAFWAALAFLPILLNNQPLTWQVVLLVLFIFFRILVNAIFSDFKDVDTDKTQGYKTVPAVLGIPRSIIFLHLVNVLSFGILVVGIVLKLFPIATSVLSILLVYNFFYINTAGKKTAKNIRLISYIVVDGEYLLWPLLLWIALYIF